MKIFNSILNKPLQPAPLLALKGFGLSGLSSEKDYSEIEDFPICNYGEFEAIDNKSANDIVCLVQNEHQKSCGN